MIQDCQFVGAELHEKPTKCPWTGMTLGNSKIGNRKFET